MKSIREIRRENMLSLAKNKELTLYRMGHTLGLLPTYLYQIRKDIVGMGAKFARRIEQAFDLPEGGMDTEHPVQEPTSIHHEDLHEGIQHYTRDLPPEYLRPVLYLASSMNALFHRTQP